jgi:DNA replication protein DnaC
MPYDSNVMRRATRWRRKAARLEPAGFLRAEDLPPAPRVAEIDRALRQTIVHISAAS